MTTTVDEAIEPEAQEAPEAVEAPLAPAEAEATPEPAEAPAGPPEPGEAASEPLSEKQLEKAISSLEREASRHANRISEIMGEEAQLLLPCPLCAPATPGFRFPVEPDDETKQLVREAIGDAAQADYLKAPDARPCDTCGALGRVLTGSLVPEHRTKLCPACTGAGYVLVGGPSAAPSGNASGNVSAPPLTPEPEPPASTDPWGRTRDDPRFGIMPGYER